MTLDGTEAMVKVADIEMALQLALPSPVGEGMKVSVLDISNGVVKVFIMPYDEDRAAGSGGDHETP